MIGASLLAVLISPVLLVALPFVSVGGIGICVAVFFATPFELLFSKNEDYKTKVKKQFKICLISLPILIFVYFV